MQHEGRAAAGGRGAGPDEQRRVVDLRSAPPPATGLVRVDDDALVVCVGLSPARTVAVLDALGDSGSLVVARDAEHARRLLGHAVESVTEPAPERAPTAGAARVHRVGALVVDEETRRVTWSGTPIALSVKEFDLLCTLARAPGRVHTFAELTRRVWSRDYLGDDDSVVSTVKRLRRRLGSSTARIRVESVRGVGFRLVDDPAQSFSTGA